MLKLFWNFPKTLSIFRQILEFLKLFNNEYFFNSITKNVWAFKVLALPLISPVSVTVVSDFCNF